MAEKPIDILIVGGGLIGASLLIALNNLGLSVKLVEANPLKLSAVNPQDRRNLTLSPSSVALLQTLAIWPLIAEHVTPIHSIHISQQHQFGSSKITGTPSKPLGYVIEIQRLGKALYERINPQQLIIPAQLTAFDSTNRLATLQQGDKQIIQPVSLLIAADGADSSVRALVNLKAHAFDYGQHALVTNISLARSHHNQAYERFTRNGPMAMVPQQGLQAGLIWPQPPQDALLLQAMSKPDFLSSLQRNFGYRLGRFLDVGQRIIYPLRYVFMPQQVTDSVVFIGNAAHTLHPVAGQGFNLGLRDVASLAQHLTSEGLNATMLQNYAASRRHDQDIIRQFTDTLATVFNGQSRSLSLARGAGLVLFDNLPPLKRLLSRYTQGFADNSIQLFKDAND